MSLSSGGWTQSITNQALAIDQSWGLTTLSILLTAGTGSIIGNLTINSLASQSIPLQLGVPFTIISSSKYPITGYTITANSGGTVLLFGN